MLLDCAFIRTGKFWSVLKKLFIKFIYFSAEIVFKEGDTEHYVEVEILYDGVREMREALTVHLKPDENMVAETKVKIKPNLHII